MKAPGCSSTGGGGGGGGGEAAAVVDWWSERSPAQRREHGMHLFLHELPVAPPRFSKQQKAAFKAAAAAAAASGRPAPMRVGAFQQQRTNMLLHAAAAGDLAAAAAILRAGADIDAVNGYGQTAVFAAAWQGHVEVVRALLEFGADVSLRTNAGSTCASVATALGHPQALRALLSRPVGSSACGDGGGGCGGSGSDGGDSDGGGSGGGGGGRPTEGRPAADLDVATEAAAAPVVLLRTPWGTAFHTQGDAVLPDAVLRQLDAALAGCCAEVRPHGERHTDPHRRFFCDEEGWVTAAIREALRRSGVTQLPLPPDAAAAGAAAATTAVYNSADATPAGSAHERHDERGRAHNANGGGADTGTTGGAPSDGTVCRPAPSPPPTAIEVVPYMRFLVYDQPGQQLLPHVDSAKYGVVGAAKNNQRQPAAGNGGGGRQQAGSINNNSNNKPRRSTHTFIIFLSDCGGGGAGATQFVGDVTTMPPVVRAQCEPARGRLLVFPHRQPHAGAVTGAAPKVLLRGELI